MRSWIGRRRPDLRPEVLEPLHRPDAGTDVGRGASADATHAPEVDEQHAGCAKEQRYSFPKLRQAGEEDAERKDEEIVAACKGQQQSSGHNHTLALRRKRMPVQPWKRTTSISTSCHTGPSSMPAPCSAPKHAPPTKRAPCTGPAATIRTVDRITLPVAETALPIGCSSATYTTTFKNAALDTRPQGGPVAER